MIHATIVLRGMVPTITPTFLKKDPMDDSILFPTDSTQFAIVVLFCFWNFVFKVLKMEIVQVRLKDSIDIEFTG